MSNPYQAPYESFAPFAIEAGVSERADFIRKTYTHLAGAVFAFIGLEVLYLNLIPEATLQSMLGTLLANQFGWLIVLGAFMAVSWIANSWANSTTSLSTQYMGLGLYVVAESIIFLPMLFIASHFGGADVIPTAGIITALIFAGLTAFVFITKADLSGIGPYLAIGGMAAMGFILCSVFFDMGGMMSFFVPAMIALAAGYILYDTSNVLHKYRTTQHVAASLALFASVALLFWYVLQLVMNRD